MHQSDMWATRNVWMDGHGKYKLVFILVEVVEVILKIRVSSVLAFRRRFLGNQFTFQISSISRGFFQPSQFGIVLTNIMLYHVSDVTKKGQSHTLTEADHQYTMNLESRPSR